MSNQATAAIDASQILYRVLELSNLFTEPYPDQIGSRYKLSLNEYRVLMMVGHMDAPAIHSLSETIGVSVMTISRAVATLKARKWIFSSRDEGNRRRKTLALTEEGREIFNACLPIAKRVADYALSALQADEAMAFDRHLKTIIKTLRATDNEGQSIYRTIASETHR